MATSHRCRRNSENKKSVHIINDGLDQWFTPKDMDFLLNLLKTYGVCRIVSGNTGTAIYKNEGPYDIYIDPKQISELYNVSIDKNTLNIDIDPNTFIVSAPCMVFGGLSPFFIHATDTKRYLSGKALNDQNVLNRAFQILSNELVTDSNPVNASPSYLKSLALSLFFKYVL